MSDFIIDHPVLIALVCAGIAIVYGVLQTLWLLRLPAGSLLRLDGFLGGSLGVFETILPVSLR